MPKERRPRDDPAAERRNLLPQGNDGFTCARCGAAVLPLAAGGFRNHCPECLWSRHVDVVPGDRSAGCGGLMEPVGLEGAEGSGWYVVHQCTDCGARRRASAALRDPRQPDCWEAIVALSTRAPRRGP
jgi:DNA-directed RNA polymerase subunit RPC12/RpoP